MEHRYARRMALELRVLLRTADGVVGEARLKDVSATGAGLVITNGALPSSNVVELILPPLRGMPWTRPLHARGFVVRVRRRELGLLWLQESTWSKLAELDGFCLRAAAGAHGR